MSGEDGFFDFRYTNDRRTGKVEVHAGCGCVIIIAVFLIILLASMLDMLPVVW